MVSVKITVKNALLNQFQHMFPDMPPYVLKTLIFETFHKNPKEVKKFEPHFIGSTWENSSLHLSMKDLTPQTQLSIRMRKHLLKNKEIRKDRFKHDIKYLHMKYEGTPYPEPLILSKRNDGFEIYSGWHQAVLSFDLWPDGFHQNCWVEHNKIFTS